MENEKNNYFLKDILVDHVCSWYCCLWFKYM